MVYLAIDYVINYVRDFKKEANIIGLAGVCDTLQLKQLISSEKFHVNDKMRAGGFTALHFAVSEEELNNARILLEAGADINAKNAFGETPLHRAIMTENIEVLEFLISNGADINAQKRNGFTPLHKAVFFQKKEVVKFLLKSGADENIKDNGEQTPKDYAITQDMEDIFRVYSKP
jgi:ankyrin repeat protein